LKSSPTWPLIATAATRFCILRSILRNAVSASLQCWAIAGPGVAGSGASATLPSAQKRFILFLFDDRHLNSSDLAITQTAAIKMLDEPFAATDYGAVLSFSGVNSGITRDRAVLQAAIKKLKVHRTFQHDTRDCPDIDYYSADRILNQLSISAGRVGTNRTSSRGARELRRWGKALLPVASDPRTIRQQAVPSARNNQPEEKTLPCTLGSKTARSCILNLRRSH
jgi:hypothetical protein